jgi:hypothetical protein
MESLMKTHPYQGLQGILRIVPITTMNGFASGHPAKPWSDQGHMEIVKTDLARIKTYLEDGWFILGWQNQGTVKNSGHPYAVGGGVVKNLPPDISNLIQSTLKQYAKTYEK